MKFCKLQIAALLLYALVFGTFSNSEHDVGHKDMNKKHLIISATTVSFRINVHSHYRLELNYLNYIECNIYEGPAIEEPWCSNN